MPLEPFHFGTSVPLTLRVAYSGGGRFAPSAETKYLGQTVLRQADAALTIDPVSAVV